MYHRKYRKGFSPSGTSGSVMETAVVNMAGEGGGGKDGSAEVVEKVERKSAAAVRSCGVVRDGEASEAGEE